MKTYIFKPVFLIVTIMIVGFSGYHAAGLGGRPALAGQDRTCLDHVL